MSKGKIVSVEDGGSLWFIFYKPRGGRPQRVAFDWRRFADFYEGTSGRSFYHDYKFGAGRDIIEDYFKGKTLLVVDDEEGWKVKLEG